MLVLKAVCSECATINDNDAKFCKHCGVGSHDKKKVESPNPYATSKPDRCPSCDRLMFNKTCFFCTPTTVYA